MIYAKSRSSGGVIFINCNISTLNVVSDLAAVWYIKQNLITSLMPNIMDTVFVFILELGQVIYLC